MFDLDSDDFQPGRNNVDWLETVKRANLKSDAREFHPYRVFGGVFAAAIHHVEWFSEKKGGKTGFPRLCPRLNPETLKLDRCYADTHPRAGQLVDCAHCEDLAKLPRFRYYLHAIDRWTQTNSPGTNPVVVLDLPETAIISITEKKKLNVHAGVAYSVAHPLYGHDIYIKVDPNAQPAKQYSVERGNPSPLSEAELAYPKYDLKDLYTRKGLIQASPEDLREFLKRVKLIGDGGTSMPAGGGAAAASDQLPESWGGPSFAGGGFGATGSGPGAVPAGGFNQGGFQPPAPTQPQGFQPPSSAPAQGFVPPQSFTTPASAQVGGFTPPTEAAQPQTARFSGPPQTQTPQGLPAGVQMPSGVQMPTTPTPGAGPVQLNVVGNAALPDCYKDDNTRGLPKCSVCPVKKDCWEIAA